MTDNKFELTRRKVLASAGVIGIASSSAGLGTSAYFSDTETFDGNTLTAGELDLTVDWQEHYYNGSVDHNDDRTDDIGGDESDTDLDGDGIDDFGLIRTKGDPNQVPSGYVGFPSFDEPIIAVPEDFVDDFLDNTAVEAFPDGNNDGIQDLIWTRDQISTQNPTLSPEEIEEAFHDQFADVPNDLEAPLIELDDVKPGDFGEVTFSIHMHNNPGYLWLRGELQENAENGFTEPEAEATDEDTDPSESGELLDRVRAVAWHDDGDNVREDEEVVNSPHDVEDPSNITLGPDESLIASGTLADVLEGLSDGAGIPLDSDPSTTERDCFPYSTTRYFGFAWWVPTDVGNEIQTDSVSFDIGFYTEQCRHNDGSGMADKG